VNKVAQELTTNRSFAHLEEELDDIAAYLNKELFKKARWFQQKSAEITAVELEDYLSFTTAAKEELLFSLVLNLKLALPTSKKPFTCIYYFPLLITHQQQSKEEWLTINGPRYRAYAYEAINEISYVRQIESFLHQEATRKLPRDSQLSGHWLKREEVSAARQFTDVSSNSITFLKKDEIMKTFRYLQSGINPELEISLKLQQKTDFTKFPHLKGYAVYQAENQDYIVALIQEFIENDGDLWSYTQQELKKLLSSGEVSKNYIDLTGQVGRTIGELHLALASLEEEAFVPRLPQAKELVNWGQEVTEYFSRLLAHLQEEEEISDSKELILQLSANQERIEQIISSITDYQDQLGYFIRCHGDLHLEQLLKTEAGVVILDFEGEPAEDLAKRRCKTSPLKDIAGMLRSYNYAIYAAYFDCTEAEQVSGKLIELLKGWEQDVREIFTTAYLKEIKGADFAPNRACFNRLTALFELKKALYEALYEVNNRPKWLPIPLKGIIECIKKLEKNK
jgi:trehalose synthase-fused probable maltokinase